LTPTLTHPHVEQEGAVNEGAHSEEELATAKGWVAEAWRTTRILKEV